MNLPIYLDYAATTPVDLQVANKMSQCLTIEGIFANPASTHVLGKIAKVGVDFARAQVANLIHADLSEIIWTSGATEANNLALRGVAKLYQQKGKHIVTVKTEHASVLDSCQQLEKEGFTVTYLNVDKHGLIKLEELESVLTNETILVSIMHVNNETGVIQDIEAIGNITSKKNIFLHVDAVQSAGKLLIDVDKFHIDLLSLSAHKLYGPKGIGALYVRKKPRIRVAPLILGGGQENGMRSGTLATHQIIGMGLAFEIAKEQMTNDINHNKLLNTHFVTALSKLENIQWVSSSHCVPNIINFCLKGISSKTIIDALPDLCFSAGSACMSKGVEPSYVIRALGLSAQEARCCIRVSFGRYTTIEEIDTAANMFLTLCN